ncbi:MAG TPA: hypothetical protein VFY29_18970 [Terriglobia bacterium]|nr:hypothetical protein [Terriglobia bacterium]
MGKTKAHKAKNQHPGGRGRARSLEALDVLAALVADFDYAVDPEDFTLYELASAIEEDRASLDDSEFQAIIDEGIHQHVETNIAVRAALTGVFRSARPTLAPETRIAADRLIRALEDFDIPLRDAAVVVRSYTGYLIQQLDRFSDTGPAAEDLAAQQIEQWRAGHIDLKQLSGGLAAIGRPAVAPVADLLFDSPEDRTIASAAIDILAHIGSGPAARALAHAIAEPMLEEDVEQQAFERLQAMWSLPRHYMLATLRRHEHEDLPVRWFQLLAECGEVEVVERTLEEFARHGADPGYREDLATILGFLRRTGDPELPSKMLDALNDPRMDREAAEMLEGFLKGDADSGRSPSPNSTWSRRDRLAAIHTRYRAAAELADTGRVEEAAVALDRVLEEEPEYPFAAMLKRVLRLSS